MITVKLKKDRHKSLERKHPWVFSGAIETITGEPENGETVRVVSGSGKNLAQGAFSVKSQISIRVWSFDVDEKIDSAFFRRKIEQAYELRKQLINFDTTNAYRLINAESDELPGLIADVYNNFVVCQFLSAGAEYWKEEIVKIISTTINPTGIYERSDVEIREKEGLKMQSGVLYGQIPPDVIEVIENNHKFFVNIKKGHKSGFYLDQRDNRKIFAEYVKDKTVLNCFSYSGGFSVYAAKAGAAMITNVDSSVDSLELAGNNFRLNGFNDTGYENICDDVFKYLRKLRDINKSFDVIVLDPPKFAESSSQVAKASRGYKDINLLAFKLLKKNGILFTFSCSGHITMELFNKIISDAALDSGRNVKILNYLKQSTDHIISPSIPESLYLKGLICKVI